MQEQKLNINEVIKVESLPKIFYQLEQIGKVVNESLKGIDKMECNEENKAEVKRRKQEIAAFKNVMEERRKEIKNQIMYKYNEFNAKYEEEIKGKLIDAEKTLSEKYLKIENEQKLKKEEEIREFFEEHCKEKNVNVQFERMGLNITLSASMKSLKEQTLAFIEKIASDLQLIELEEYKEEILLEYNKTLDFGSAKLTVMDRHKLINEIKENQKKDNEKKEKEKEIIKEIEEIIEMPEEIIEVQFTVKTTISKAKKLKDFLLSEGIEYE